MRKYLLPSLLILCLAGGYALAQTITRALQLSQDVTGAFSVDTNSGVYFPGHQLTTGNSPALTACGGGTPTIRGTDTAGEITMGTASVGCIATFARAYLTQPYCTFSSQAALATPLAAASNALGTGFIVTQVGTSSNKVNYACTSAS
jgi:hypothetical protein